MNRIYVALDLPSLEEASILARSIVDDVAGFKVGLELFGAEGPKAITEGSKPSSTAAFSGATTSKAMIRSVCRSGNRSPGSS